MARSRFKDKSRRNLAFTDRITVLGDIDARLAPRSDGLDPLTVVSLIGLGGFGKSRLLDEIALRARNTPDTKLVVRVTLESESTGTIIAPLKAIRDKLNFQCLLFDCGLVSYWAGAGLPFRMAEKNRLSKNKFLGAIEASAGVAGFGLPLGFAAEMFESAKREFTRKRLYEKVEFEAIDELRDSPNQLLDRLPHYLGLDIERHLRDRGRQIVLLYDSYEKQTRGTLQRKAEWLRELIGTLNRGLHIIASRESLRWPSVDWQDVMTETAVGPLPDKDCQALLRKEISAPNEIVDHITQVSRGVPFFVEAFIDAYLATLRNRDNVSVELLPSSLAEVTSRLIDHLPLPDREIVMGLALIQFFDLGLVRALIRDLHLPLAYSFFENLTEFFFVETVRKATGLYKVHDILVEFVRHANEPERYQMEVSAVAIRHLLSQSTADEYALNRLAIFSGVLHSAADRQSQNVDFIETAIDSGYQLYDSGYWNELLTISSNEALRRNGDGSLVARFFGALSLRRTRSIAEARNELIELKTMSARLGKQRKSLDLEVAYLGELSGDYEDARAIITNLYAHCDPFDPSERAHVRCALYYADMLTMDGQFAQGNKILIETSEALLATQHQDWAEFTRHRAHAFRYSLLFNDAENLYLRAMSAVSGASALTAKLLGNLADCQCWTDPRRAVVTGTEALDANERLHNKVEIGKNHVALCIAFGLLNDSDAAEIHYREAKRQALEVGYTAGRLFAEAAGAITAHLAGKIEQYSDRLSAMSDIVANIGTYRHILLIPMSLGVREADANRVLADTSWIEAKTIRTRLRTLVKKVQSSHAKG